MTSRLMVACCLWDANEHSQMFSQCYDESWVEKLYRGFRRNLTLPFDFVCFVDRWRRFEGEICQLPLQSDPPTYGSLIEPFKLDTPMIFVGLDTIVCGNIDHMAQYCLESDVLALPRDPYKPERSINGVVLAPSGMHYVYEDWNGGNDMEHLRQYPWNAIDDLWPGQVLSLKFHKVRDLGLQQARIVYFHGNPKPHMLTDRDFIQQHWR